MFNVPGVVLDLPGVKCLICYWRSVRCDRVKYLICQGYSVRSARGKVFDVPGVKC